MKITYEINGMEYTENVPIATVRRIVTAEYRYMRKQKLAQPPKPKFNAQQMWKMREIVVLARGKAAWDKIKENDDVLAKIWEEMTKLA